MDDSHIDTNNTKFAGTKRTKPPGLKEIAAYLDLSPATVSMVINDVPLAKSLSEDTRARVLAAAKHFNYRPNLLARALSKRETRTIGVIAPESSDGYFTRVMRGIETAMLKTGYLYFTASHLGRPDLIREYPNALTQRGVDGLIFVNTPVYEDPGVPAASVSDGDCTVDGITQVVVDQGDGMQRALEHLVQLGHRRIAVMRGSEHCLDAGDRFGAILRAAERLGVPILPELTLELDTNQLTPEVGYRAMLGLLNTGAEFSAVLAFNDMSAVGAMRALEDHGLLCPRDVSILGVDDISTAAFLSPRLSTCAQPLEVMGAAAVEHLVAMIQRPQEKGQTRVVFPMTLQARESTGPAPAMSFRRMELQRRSPAKVVVAQRPIAAGPQLSSSGR